MGACKSTQLGCCIALDSDESIILDKPTGRETRRGPGWFFFPNWWEARVVKSIPLQNNEYLVIKHVILPNSTNANRSDKIPFEKGVTSQENDELINDPEMQLLEIIRGPQIYHINNPYDIISGIKPMIDLSATQYIVIMDKLTGAKRVESGPKLFCPKPYDAISDVQNMYNLSSTEYIVVTDESTGKKQTVTGKLKRFPNHRNQSN